ncbi:MAG: hypothetical protein KUG71_11755 [Porticoccaceae bacterium]|nr:hypothetical protein [Porticoccaceae bacterium]
MYARHITFKSTSERRNAIESLAREIYDRFKSLQGFVRVIYLVSEDETSYGSLSIWDSKDDAEGAGVLIRDEFGVRLGELVVAPPETVFMEVIEPDS